MYKKLSIKTALRLASIGLISEDKIIWFSYINVY